MSDSTSEATLKQLEALLDGSPYLLDTSDPDLLERFGKLNQKRLKNKAEWDEVHDALEELGGLSSLQNDERVPFTHQSNRLEFEGPDTQQGTEAALGDLLDVDLESSDVVAGRMILESLTGDERVTRGGDIAFRYAWQIAGEPDLRIDQSEIRSINQILETGKQYRDRRQHPGAYRTREAAIAYGGNTDAGRETTAPVLIEPQMSELVSWLNKNLSNVYEFGPMIACVAHAWLTDIHPFMDGNGRTARLVANIILAHGRWPPLVIKAEQRPRYLEALEESDPGGHIFPLYELFLEFLERRMRIIQNQDEVAQSVHSFRHDQVRMGHYDAWKEASKALLGIFADRLIDESLTRKFDDFPDFEDYSHCRVGLRIPRVWALRAAADGQDFLLAWHGHNGPIMKEELDARGEVFAPSMFFDVWRPGKEVRSWASAADAGASWSVDELCILLPEGEDVNVEDARVIFRLSGQVSASELGRARYGKTPARFWRGDRTHVYECDLDEAAGILLSETVRLVTSS